MLRLFELHLSGRGDGLRRLASDEHLIHDEAMGKLRASCQAHQVLPTELVTEDDANEIFQGYMLSFIYGRNLSQMSLKEPKHF